MRLRLIGCLLVLALVPRFAGAAPEAADDEALYSCKSRTSDVVVTLKPETELKDLVTWVMGFTCKEFVFDPRIVSAGKKVNIVAPNKLTPREAYQMFLVALATVNLTVVAKGKTLRIIDAPAGKSQTLPLYQHGMPDSSEQLIRYVLRPAHTQVDTLARALTLLKSEAGDLQAVGSILVMTDYASKVREMLSIVKLIDVPNGTDAIYTIPVKHADATKLVAKLDPFLAVAPQAAAAKPGGPSEPAAVPSKLMVDDRTNTIIVAASEAAYQRVRALVERIDIAIDTDGGAAFHVIPLANAKADELAQTLTQAITGQAPAAQPAGKPPAQKPAAPLDGLGATLEGQVRVIADKPSSSLIVVSSGRDFLAIRNVIKELDQPRRQVYIEAMIVEVNLANSWQLGGSAHLGNTVGTQGGVAVGAIENGINTLALGTQKGATSLGGVSGFLGALLGKSINILGQTVPSYAVLFQAFANNSDTRILSAPGLIAVDNGKAMSKIGISVPTPKLSIGGLGTDSIPGAVNQSFEYKDLLLELEIEPHITAGDMVYMDIKHGAADLGDRTEFGQSFTKRELATSALVHDQQTVVIGGLMQERTIKTTNKVPLLGDVPLLGYLFKWTGTNKRKTNLLILITPYIVKDQLDLQQLKERKLREQGEFLSAYRSLADMPYRPHIDYGKKRGLVEEINRSVLDVEEDAAARRALDDARPPGVTPGPVEPNP